jgi:ribonuclease Z
MAKLVFLGTSNAVPDEKHENTHLILVGESRSILIDCGPNPLVRLKSLELDCNAPSDLLLTHFHPDHVGGVPSFLLSLWLLGRTRPLNIYAIAHTLDRFQAMMTLYEWETWSNFYTVNFKEIPLEKMALVLENDEFRVFSSPVKHVIPNIGVRIEIPDSGAALAYSSDTEPCQAVVGLASGADILIHESTGDELWHSSAAQAGDIARQAGVKQLYLIHYTTRGIGTASLIAEAEAAFGGPVFLAEDLLALNL